MKSLFPDAPEKWPCGCIKGETPHGAGWLDCEFSGCDGTTECRASYHKPDCDVAEGAGLGV